MSARAAAGGIAVLLLSCGGAYLTAPSGSTLTLIANPDRIASHGGVSELMAIVIEPAGTDVPDGTVVLWTTNLGHVQRETRTQNGIARNRLVADSRSGTALVTATSGAVAQVPTPNPSASPSPGTPTTTTTPTSTTTTTLGQGEGLVTSQRLMGAARNVDTVPVTIGNALVQTVSLRAVPSRITVSNSTHVIATVLDTFGNPVANVPVFFEVDRDRDYDFFDSAGAAVFTDNNGEAEDVLRTRRPFSGPPTIRVRALATGPGAFVPSPLLDIPVV